MNLFSLVFLQTVTAGVMLVGLFSLITFLIPGLVIIWIAALIYGILVGFDLVGGILFAFITILMLIGSFIDNILMNANARIQGTSWLALGIATLAGITGSILIPPFGGLIAALVSIFVVEFVRFRNIGKAWLSTRSMASGCGWATAARFVIGIIMILWWIVWAAKPHIANYLPFRI